MRTSSGSRPELDVTARPVSILLLSPATLTMKNSSRLEAKILRKFTLSRRGSVLSSASSKTLSLKDSQDNSRSRKRSCGKSCPSGGRVIAIVSSDMLLILAVVSELWVKTLVTTRDFKSLIGG